MEAFDVTHLGALLAGILSFASPCVLPLVPPYLCFLAGVSFDQMTGGKIDRGVTRRVTGAAILFVLGFTTVFVALGATATALGGLMADYADVLAKVAGAVIVVLGLHMAGLFRISALNRDMRIHVQDKPVGFLAAYLIGLAFAFGWTPCVGPVLAGVLTVAGGKDSAIEGAALLGTYSLGMGAPFIVAAFAARPFMAFMQKFRRHLRKVELAMGALLVVTGVMIFTNSFEVFGFWLLEAFPSFGQVG